MTARAPYRGLNRIFFLPAILVLLFMLLPVIVVVAISFGASASYQFPPHGVSLRWFAAFLDNPIFSDALFRISLPLGLAVAAVSTAIGTLAAIGIARGGLPGRRMISVLFVAPVIFPQILLGVGLFMFYARLGLTPSLATLGIGHVLIGTPYVIRTVGAALAGTDPRLEEAAQNLGAGPVRAFCLTTLPIMRASILSGAIFAFIISFSDINLALFLSAADVATLPVQILAQMQFASDPTIAAASTVQVVIITALVLATQRVISAFRR